MTTRVLFLDDSGKPSAGDSSGAVVIGGFAVPSEDALKLHRRISEAKSAFFPHRGNPARWEVKAAKTISPRRWKRLVNRRFVDEIAEILTAFDCTVYSASIDKRRMAHQLRLSTTTPLQFQALIEHFTVECAAGDETGMIVSDWSNQRLDALVSRSITSFVLAHSLPLHPGVYYADSEGSHAIQVADLLAGIRRRSVEGDSELASLGARMAEIRSNAAQTGGLTHTGRRFRNQIVLL